MLGTKATPRDRQRRPEPRRGTVSREAGKPAESIPALQAGLKEAPHYSPGINHLLLSIAHERLGDQEKSDRAYRRGVEAGIPVIHVHDTLEYQVLLREAKRSRGLP